MRASYQKYILNFKRPSGTSRGVLTEKETWLFKLEENGKVGYGECGILRGLSADDRSDYNDKIEWLSKNCNRDKSELLQELAEFPSIQFGFETALQSLRSANPFKLFPSDFTRGNDAIPINGLIWMGEKPFMKEQIETKLKQGFSCIKLKIGAIDFDKELELIQFIREQFPADQLEIRVDANGGFSPKEALSKLKTLNKLGLHSIEQPIQQNQPDQMAELCAKTPLPIALDEELIGKFSKSAKKETLEKIAPRYIILKPSLIGGFSGAQDWLDLAEKNNTGWWITSALESNIGLNAIAQWTYTKNTTIPQGLGTGSLYTNNIPSPLEVKGETICYNPELNWDIRGLEFTRT